MQLAHLAYHHPDETVAAGDDGFPDSDLALDRLGYTCKERNVLSVASWPDPGTPDDVAFLATLNYWPEDEPGLRRKMRRTVDDLIARGYLEIRTGRSRLPPFPEHLPHPRPSAPRFGRVMLTRKGFFAHRDLSLAVGGRTSVQRGDSFTLTDRAAREIRYYAETEALCRKWSHDTCHFRADERIEEQLDQPAEVVSVHGPEPIGPWSPSRFLVLPRGYWAAVRYRPLRRRRIRLPEYGLAGVFDRLRPTKASGDLGPGDFFFLDCAGSWKEDAAGNETCTFGWSFAASPAGRDDIDFWLSEPRRRGRHRPITVERARELIALCAKNYVLARERGLQPRGLKEYQTVDLGLLPDGTRVLAEEQIYIDKTMAAWRDEDSGS